VDETLRETPWRQVNIAYPGTDRQQRERHAVGHLARTLPAAEASGLITSWWWIRKGSWRVRYLLTEETGSRDPLHPLLSASVTWTGDIYEPEVHAFGGHASMDTAHALFHRDSRHLLSYLHNNPADRQEHSLVLCTALMRAAGLDWNEQGDVWAKVAEQRDGLQAPIPTPQAWASYTSDVRLLMLGTARADTIADDWLTAFGEAGRALRALRETGELTRGLRAVIALHVIFHLNRIGIPSTTQATLAQAAKDTVFGSTSA
jgi:thiopeptide-type bacteriocin biosynthesis protein